MALTPKQQRFVRAYAKTLNATQAAVDAGYAGGDRDRCSQAAWRVMKQPEVRAAIEGLKERATLDGTLSAKRVLEELRRLAFCDLRSLYGDDGHIKPLKDWTAEQGSTIQEAHVAMVNGTPVLKVRFWDKTKALEMLAKHYTLTSEKTELTGTITISWLAPERDVPPTVEGEVVKALPPAQDAPGDAQT